MSNETNNQSGKNMDISIIFTKVEEVKVAFIPFVKRMINKVIKQKQPKITVAEEDLGLSK